ncbi:hypothetical protein D3C81_2014510 [compost metagenome]
MVNGLAVDQRRCRGDNTMATSVNNAVVLPFAQAKIIRIHNQYAFHSRPLSVLFAFERLDAPGKVWQPFFMGKDQFPRQNFGITVRMHQWAQI